MIKSHKVRSVAMAVGALAAMFSASSANAYTYGVSHLEIKELMIVIGGPSVTNSVSSYSFTLNGDASFLSNGTTQANSAACSTGFPCATTVPTLNLLPISATGSSHTHADNTFAFLGTAPLPPSLLDNYASSDSVIFTSELLTVPASKTRTQQISEALLNTNDLATSNSKVGSSTGFVFTFDVAAGEGPASVALDFMADADMRVENTTPSFNNGSVDMNATFTLRKTGVGGGGTVTWSPKGTSANDCVTAGLVIAVTCTENLVGGDGENLNQQISTNVTPDTQSNGISFTAAADYTTFGIKIDGLEAGTYSIILSAGTGVVLERNAAVPEPGSLALLGVALAGLGLATSRRKSKQA